MSQVIRTFGTLCKYMCTVQDVLQAFHCTCYIINYEMLKLVFRSELVD